MLPYSPNQNRSAPFMQCTRPIRQTFQLAIKVLKKYTFVEKGGRFLANH